MIPTPHEVGNALTMYAIVHMFYWGLKMFIKHAQRAEQLKSFLYRQRELYREALSEARQSSSSL